MKAGDRKPGKLILVPTPIGNLEDMSPRARRVLQEADLIAAEDTRDYKKLCREHGLEERPVFSCHEHNEKSREAYILERLSLGQSIALISDAGMPAISDPGERIVRAAREAGFEVSALPGPNAAITALAASGLPTRPFHFEGFIPASGAERKESLRRVQVIPCTIVLYESPHRLLKTLTDLCELGLSERKLCLAREISKSYECYDLLLLREACEKLRETEARGEYVLILEGEEACLQRSPELAVRRQEVEDDEVRKRIREELAMGNSPRAIRDCLLQQTDIPRNRLYRLIQEEKKREGSDGP